MTLCYEHFLCETELNCSKVCLVVWWGAARQRCSDTIPTHSVLSAHIVPSQVPKDRSGTFAYIESQLKERLMVRRTHASRPFVHLRWTRTSAHATEPFSLALNQTLNHYHNHHRSFSLSLSLSLFLSL